MTGTSAESSTRWHARPRVARLVHVAAFLVPVGASVAFVYVASRLVQPPTSGLALYLGWWLGLSLLATVVLVSVGRLCRRLLPLAALLRLSLVFPDATPSRFRTAIASGTVRTLEERIADAHRADATPAEAAESLLALAAALDDHDGLTRGHSERVRAYSQVIGRELGLDPHELDLLNWAALLHDIGKLEIPGEILNKTGRPTDEEWTAIRSHPQLGERLVAPLRGWLGEWASAVGDHHEHWDGGGYPRGTAGTEISLAGRIVAVADVFDVITSTRSYKQASTMAAARAEVARCAGSQFDPEVVRAFLAASFGHARTATGPMSWLAQAAVLVRAPLTTTAGTLSAAAVVGVSVATGGIVERGPRPAASTPTGAPAALTASVGSSLVGPTGFSAELDGAAERAGKTGRADSSPASPGHGTPAPAEPPLDGATTARGPERGDTRGSGPSTPVPVPPETPPLPLPVAPELPPLPSVPTVPPLPTAPPLPSVPPLPSAPSLPSPPSVPSAPSVPSVPSEPALPSAPSLPAAPSVPSVPKL